MDNRLKLLIPYDEIEKGAQEQIENILQYDFVKKLAIMPDVHMGYTLPIGGVALMDNVISPECVGVDIGCGMCHANIGKLALTEKDKIDIYNQIRERIPVGFSMRNKPIDCGEARNLTWHGDDDFFHKMEHQVGTLGGGNHFIEIGENAKGEIGVTIHSGSRGCGKIVADHYIEISKSIDKDLPSGFLYRHSNTGICYWHDMNIMTDYALKNRKIMMMEIFDILGVKDCDIVNENHNFADDIGDGMFRHRKGATPAELGQIGIIPANMRDGVYVTKGLGNEKYLSSASHGAGRRFSRNQARKNISINDFEAQMIGIVGNVCKDTLDEAPDAYKDINTVIGLQNGVNIEVVDFFKPIINIKG